MVKADVLRKRTSRIHFAIPVFVYGHSAAGAPFKEIATTQNINANGCLLELETPLVKDQTILLTNMKSNEEIPCHVVTLGNVNEGKTQVGLSFATPSPRFWGLAFPPEDWDPSTRKRPGPANR